MIGDLYIRFVKSIDSIHYRFNPVLLPTTGHRWVKTPNDDALFQGAPPLRLMIEGNLHGLRQVRTLLAAERGW